MVGTSETHFRLETVLMKHVITFDYCSRHDIFERHPTLSHKEQLAHCAGSCIPSRSCKRHHTDLHWKKWHLRRGGLFGASYRNPRRLALQLLLLLACFPSLMDLLIVFMKSRVGPSHFAVAVLALVGCCWVSWWWRRRVETQIWGNERNRESSNL